MNESNVASLTVQADLILSEAKVIDVAVWVCETNGLPETARQLRHSVKLLRASAQIIRMEVETIEANV